jgi:putative ABC transport system permease protein
MTKLVPQKGTVVLLAMQDLLHERLLALCVAGSLAAVIAPLLILFGLRTGVVEALRADLVDDPVFRELRPEHSMPYGPAFFTMLQERPDIVFAIPTIGRGASVVGVRLGGRDRAFDMLPSGAGDPLAQVAGLDAPEEGEALLSETAAAALGASPGDRLLVTADRTVGGKVEQAQVELSVIGVLPLRADDLARIYVSLALTEDIESFRSGFAVADRGWPGTTPIITPAFDGAYLALPEPLDRSTQLSLTADTGFFRQAKADPALLRQRLAEPVPSLPVIIDLSVIERGADPGALTRIERKLRGRPHQIFPYVDRLEVAVLLPDGERLEQVLQVRSEPDLDDAAVPSLEIALPRDFEQFLGQTVLLEVQTIDGTVQVPVKVVGVGNHVVLPVLLAGALRRGLERPMMFDQSSKRLLQAREGHSGFRLYARSIDDVPDLVDALAAQGVPTRAEVATILRIQKLDAGLKALFWLIAGIAALGGLVVLLADLYGAVERKAADLGQLRLLGLRRWEVCRFPIYQALCLALIAGLGGLIVAGLAALVINLAFARDLGFEQVICRMTPEMVGSTLAVAVIMAPVAATAAAARVYRIDPAEVLRAE